jgi:hypothetical protein
MSENKFAAAGKTARARRAKAGETTAPGMATFVFSTQVPTEVARTLKSLGVDLDRSIKDLTEEALRDLFVKYEKKTIVVTKKSLLK